MPAGDRGLCATCQLVADLNGECGLPADWKQQPEEPKYAHLDPQEVLDALDRATLKRIG